MVKLDIVAGFLGAGKTTLINKLLAECWQADRPVLIENEFGDVPIDLDLIADPEIQVKSLASGCICCSLKNNFIQGITQVVERYQPRRILIEPTGLADLEDVLAACALASEQVALEINSVITVVSAENLLPLLDVGGAFFRRQIQEARFVLISCAQLCAPEELQEAMDAVRKINPHCPILSESWDKLDGLAITTAAEEATAQYVLSHADTIQQRGDTQAPPPGPSHGCEQGDACSHHHHGTAADFTSLTVSPQRQFTPAEVDDLLGRLKSPAFGQVLRAKGFLTLRDGRRILAEYVYGRGTQIPSVYKSADRFVIIGKDLNVQALTALFGERAGQ